MYDIDDLMYLMSRLRDPVNGCPWDIKQDFTSITQSTLEEAYELVDAIELSDMDQVREELGDVLFQVVFYAQLGDEKALFDFKSIVHGLTEKLVRRHPHVFPDGKLKGVVGANNLQDGDVVAQWDDIKQQERHNKALMGILDDIPKALPALGRASKIQKRMSKVGFDWEALPPVIEKLQEEVQELTEAIESGRQTCIEEEMGDLLFSCVNLSRHLKMDAEKCLRKANRKVEDRFRFIEKSLNMRGVSLESASSEEMEKLWLLSKLQT